MLMLTPLLFAVRVYIHGCLGQCGGAGAEEPPPASRRVDNGVPRGDVLSGLF
jgi:hypothetical protein